MLDACTDPSLITEITLQPVRRQHVDAGIFFSDIMVPLKAVGVGLAIVPGTGPVVASPIRSHADLGQLRQLVPDDVHYVTQAVEALVAELGDVPLIGFAGAPFTLASYLVEGGPSKDKARTKALMLGAPDLWAALCDRLADISAEFLAVQVRAGAAAVQLFDSWAGCLSEADYREHVLPHAQKVLRAIGELGVPRIHFGVDTAELLPAMASAHVEVLGVDWRTPLDVGARRVGSGVAVPGNLDPAVLEGPWGVVADRVRQVIRAGAKAPGHVFNLGHGVPPDTDPDVLTRIVELVHTEGPQLRAQILLDAIS